LDRRAETEPRIVEDDVSRPVVLVRLLTEIVRAVGSLSRRWWPKRVDFEDIDTNTSDPIRLTHGYAGRVRWWVVDQSSTDTLLVKASASTNDVLVLTSTGTSTVTIRVEEAG